MAAVATPAQAVTAPAINTPVVTIVMENFGDSSIIGSPDAPYINSGGPFGCSGPQPGLMCGEWFSNFSNPEPPGTGSDGNTYPSLPSYIELTSADLSNFTPANCGGALSKPDSCFKDATGAVVPSSNPQENLFDQLEGSGLPNPWAAYAEGMNRNCALKGNAVSATGGYYATRHFPPVYYGDLIGPCSARAVPYVLGSAPDPTNLPQFSFVAPDTCSDMHDPTGCVVPTAPTDCTGKAGAALQQCIGDDWLANNVPPLLSHALVIVTWDEDHQEPGNSNRVLLTMNGVGAAAGVQHTEPYSLDGLLHGLQNYWGLPCIPGDGVSLHGHTPGSCSATPVRLPTTSILTVSPSSGDVGTAVTIGGTNLTGTTDVSFNGVSASFTVDSDSQITAAVPSGAITGPISVVGPHGISTTTSAFTVGPTPSTSPSSTTSPSPTTSSSPSPPSIRVIQHTVCHGKNSAPTCAWPAPTAQGDLLLAALGVAGKPAITTPVGYTQAVTSAGAVAISYRTSGGDAGSVAYKLSAGRAWVTDLLEVQGASPSTPPDVTATYTSGGGAVSTLRSGVTPPTTAAPEFALAVLYDASSLPGSSLTPGFSWIDTATQATRNWTGFASTTSFAAGPLEALATIGAPALARGCIAVFRSS